MTFTLTIARVNAWNKSSTSRFDQDAEGRLRQDTRAASQRLETVAKVSLMAAQLLGWPIGPVIKSAGPHSKLSFFNFLKVILGFTFA